MKAAQLIKARTYKIVEVDTPIPKSDEVLIKVKACGICMSEMGSWIGQEGVEYPLNAGMTGHEPYGIIAGGECDEFPPGATVTAILSPAYSYAEYVIAKKDAVCCIPDSMKDEIILGEPLACAVNAVKRSPIKPGNSAVIIGAGYMGLLLLSVLKHSSFAPIAVLDIKDENLELAKKAGADIVVNTQDSVAMDNLKTLVGGEGFDVVYEAAGKQATLDLATELIKIKGTLMIYGYHSINLRTVNMERWNWKAINIVNAHERDLSEYADGMKRGIKLFEYKKNMPTYITHKFALEDIEDGFKMLENHPKGYVKGVVVFD